MVKNFKTSNPVGKGHITEELSVLHIKHTMHFFIQGTEQVGVALIPCPCRPIDMLLAKFHRRNGVQSFPKVYDTAKNSGSQKVNVK